MKLIQWVNIALLFLHVTSKKFEFTTFNLPGLFLHPSVKQYLKTIY